MVDHDVYPTARMKGERRTRGMAAEAAYGGGVAGEVSAMTPLATVQIGVGGR
jgi:hypothetical protein